MAKHKAALLLVFSLVMVNPAWASDEDAVKKIEAEIEAANHCQVKDDCTITYLGCPFGCGSYLHKDEAARLKGMVEDYFKSALTRCKHECVRVDPPDCVLGRCMAPAGAIGQDKEVLSAATQRLKDAGYNLDGMEPFYDEKNALWHKRWNQIQVYIPEGASPPNPKPQDKPALLGKNYQAVYFRNNAAARSGGIWVFVDPDTKKVIYFEEEAN